MLSARHMKRYLRDREGLADLLVATKGRVRLQKKSVLLRPLWIVYQLEHMTHMRQKCTFNSSG